MDTRFSIETQRLLLRPFEVADAETYFKIVKDPSIEWYNPGLADASLEDINRYSQCDFKNNFYLLIEEKMSHEVVGCITLTQDFPKGKEYSCDYFIAKKYRRKGYMKEALHAFLNNISVTGIILFTIAKSNRASCEVVRSIKGIQKYEYLNYSNFVYECQKTETH